MTKKEQKELENNERKQFVKKAATVIAETAMDLIPLGNIAAFTLKITIKNENRYLDFHRYGTDLKFYVYRSGDIDVVLKEFCHEDVRIRLVHYEEAVGDPDKALDTLGKDVRDLIESFYFMYWHDALDFMEYYKEGDDWHDLFNEFRKCYEEQTSRSK